MNTFFSKRPRALLGSGKCLPRPELGTHQLLPSNVSEVAVQLGFEGPFCEFRQACTGFLYVPG